MSTPASSLNAALLPEELTMRETLGIVTMRRLWFAQIVSVFGDFLALFAVITYMTFELHASAQQITGVQIAYLLPIAVLGVVSGVFVDRWPVKTTLVSSDYIRAALVLLLLLVHNIIGFYVVLAAISIFSSFFNPAQGKAIRFAVPLHGLRSANALMGQVYYIMRIVGPSTAALLVAHYGARTCYVIDTVSFLASGSLIASLSLMLPGADSVPTQTSETSGLPRILADMREATHFILHHRALFFVIVALTAGMFVLGCSGPLVALYVRDILHRSGHTFAFTYAMIGLGLLVGVNSLNTFGKGIKSVTQVYLGLGGIGLGTLVMAALPFTVSGFIGCFIIGFSASGILVPSQILMQQETPVALLGRVSSTSSSAVFTAQVAGLVLSGIVTEHTSIRAVFALSSLMLASLMLIGKLWMEPKDHPAFA
jgi:MFS family permease